MKLRCDFCGRATDRVRRVALEAGYDRLTQRHAVRYACAECSSRKEAARAAEAKAVSPERPAAVDSSRQAS
ncbi:MAG: hypothetical protein ACE5IL_11450 [Myxococcota bacterium]